MGLGMPMKHIGRAICGFGLLACQTETAAEPVFQYDANKTYTENCLPSVVDAGLTAPDYQPYAATFADHCGGTAHQDIRDIQKVVFLGDSITAGTPPTPEWSYYANLLTDDLRRRYGEVEMVNCSEWGARTDDLVTAPKEQLLKCVPEPDNKTTWVVMTVGGNDMFSAAQSVLATGDLIEANKTIDRAINYFSDALHWMRDNESTHFPGGLFISFANIYEYTDATADMSACPMAKTFGFDGTVPELQAGYLRISEAYLGLAVETGSDMIMMLEQFCGHGYHADDPDSPCYRGPGQENWFDATCIHPTATGHQVIADLFGRSLSP
jgi:hypothetical protein